MHLFYSENLGKKLPIKNALIGSFTSRLIIKILAQKTKPRTLKDNNEARSDTRSTHGFVSLTERREGGAGTVSPESIDLHPVFV